MNLIDFISQPWHWSASGFGIAVVMLLLILLGNKFGVSTSFETICSLAGIGKKISYFNFDWRKHQWLLLFIGGSIIGAFIADQFLASDAPVQIAQSTINDLADLNIQTPRELIEGDGFMPREIFAFENLGTLRGLIFMIGGGILIGFGTRWAGGCTSGHAISGLSNLQLPSLIAVIGFFIGGLLMTHLFFPLMLNL